MKGEELEDWRDGVLLKQHQSQQTKTNRKGELV